MLSRKQITEYLQKVSLWLFIAQLGLLIGIEAVYIAVFTGNETFNERYGYPSLQTIGLATSLYPIFAVIGALLVLYLVHITKEIVVLSVSIYLWLIGYLVGSLVVGHMGALMAARILKGLAIGLMTSTIPLYVEKAASSRRQAAQLLTLLQTSVPLGILMMALVGKLTQPSVPFYNRWMFAAIPAFFVTVVLFNVPEAHCVERLSQENRDTGWAKVKRDFNELVKSRRAVLRCGAASLAQAAGPLTAINVIFYYSAPMCNMLGFEDDAAEYMAIGLYACNFGGTALSLSFINKLPRLATTQYSILGMGAIHSALFTARLRSDYDPNNGFLGIIAIALLFAFVFVFSFLFAGISLVYTSEVVAPRARGISIGIATAAGWLSNFVVAMVSAAILPLMGSYIFLLFAYFCCALFVCFSMMPTVSRTV